MAHLSTKAENETRKVEAFSEISLRIPATLYLEQGPQQSIEIIAKESTLQKIRTEVKGRQLAIHFPTKNLFWSNFTPGEIEIHITVPDIDALTLSGSGKIIGQKNIKSRILNIIVSGSGNIKLSNLTAERVKINLSGSAITELSGTSTAEDLSVNISGSGSYKGIRFPASDVNVKMSGSGNVLVNAQSHLKVRAAGSGDVRYIGNPLIDQSSVGSATIKKY